MPLKVRLVLLESESGDIEAAAAGLRGKGFAVSGFLRDGINRWAAANTTPSSTDLATGPQQPTGWVLDVADPGAPSVPGATRIPVETLWTRTNEIAGTPIVIPLGKGVRGALAVGMLERAGQTNIVVWRKRG